MSVESDPTAQARWNELDCKVNGLVGLLHWRIANKEIATDTAADELGQILSSFLRSEPDFEAAEKKQFFQKTGPKSLEEARVLKRELRKTAKKRNATAEDKSNWLKAVKLYAFLLRKEKGKEGKNTIKQQEKAYRKDFFKFAKEACNGTLFEERVEPQFCVDEASAFFYRIFFCFFPKRRLK